MLLDDLLKDTAMDLDTSVALLTDTLVTTLI